VVDRPEGAVTAAELVAAVPDALAQDWYMAEDALGADGLRGFDSEADGEMCRRRGCDAAGADRALFDAACAMACEIADLEAAGQEYEYGYVPATTPAAGGGLQSFLALPVSTAAARANANANANANSLAMSMATANVPGTAAGSYSGQPHQVRAVSTGPHHHHHQQHHYQHQHQHQYQHQQHHQYQHHSQSTISPVYMAPLTGVGVGGGAKPTASELAADKFLADLMAGNDDDDDSEEEEEDEEYHSAKEASAALPGGAGSKVEREERAVDAADGRRVSISPPEHLQQQGQEESSADESSRGDSDDNHGGEDAEEGEEEVEDSSAQTPAKSTSRDHDEPPDNKKSPIQRRDPWPSVWPKLKASGWSYKPPSGLELDWTYIRPGKSLETGVEGADYFKGEPSMKMYIRDRYGWRGAEGDLDEVETTDAVEAAGRAGRKGRGQRNLGTPYTTQKKPKKNPKSKSKSKSASTSESKSKSKKESSSSFNTTAKTPASKKKLQKAVAITPTARIDPNAPEIMDTPIEATDEWLIVWDKLKRSGWSYKPPSGLDTDWTYFAPDKKGVKNGVEGQDYFKGEEAVRAFCKIAYGWDPRGAKKVRLLRQAEEEEEQAKLEAKRLAKKERKEKEAADERRRLEKEAEREAERREAEEMRLAAEAAAEEKRLAKEAAAEEKRLAKEAAAEAKRKAAEEKKRIAREAKEAAKKKKKNAAGTKKGQGIDGEESRTQYNQPSPGRVWGKESCNKESPSTPIHRTKPRDPAKPRLTDSPDTGRSLTPDDKGFYEWKHLWPRLKQAGWTYQKGYGLVSWLYVRPDRNPASDGTTPGVDYFQSEDEVIEYCRQADIKEGETRTAQGTRGGTKRKASPAKADRPSAITGDFDVEASSSPSSPRRTTKKRKAEPMWWRTHPIPTSRQVWPILKNKLGFKHGSGLYRHPDAPKRNPQMNVDVFPDAQFLREYLSKTGIPNFESTDLTDDERTLLKRWVGTAYTPKGIDSHPDESVEVLRDVTVFTDNQAWALLTGKIGWEMVDDSASGETRFYKPHSQVKADGEEPAHGQDFFLSITEVQDYLRANGPFEARYNYKWTHLKTPNKGRDREIPCDVGPQEYLALTFWAARAPLPQHPSDIVEDEQEPTQGTASTPNASPAPSASSPDSPFGAYEGDHDESRDSGMDRHAPGLLSKFNSVAAVANAANAAAGAIGSVVSHAFGHQSSSPSRLTLNSTETKRDTSPYQDMVDEKPPATPDEKLRQDSIVVESLRELRALSHSPAQPSDSWEVFWGKMQEAGWAHSSEDSRLKEVYIPPIGRQIKNGGEKGIDYFTSEEEVKQFAIDHLGWEGHDDGMEIDDDIAEDGVATTPAPDRQQLLIKDAKNKMAEIKGTPVERGDNWLNVKEKMKHSGWNWYIPAPRVNGIPIGDDFVWLLPSGKKPKDGGEPGIDFLNDEMAARQFAVDHFDWGGEFKGIDQSQELRSGKSSRRRGRL